MRMLDLFAGLEGWSAPWREAGHEVCSVDIDTDFDVTIHADILELQAKDLPWVPDVILASPPCETMSMMTVGNHWTHEHTPKTEKAAIAYKLLDRTLTLMDELAPKYGWLIENPRAKMRALPLMKYLPRQTVWYCQYGLPYAKPTDLFGGVATWVPRAQCANGRPDHVASPRGSKTGIQGGSPEALRRGSLHNTKAASREYFGTSNAKKLAALRAEVPYELSAEVMRATEYAERVGAE